MSTVQQIEAAIARLKPTDKREVAAWMATHCRGKEGVDRLTHLRKARGIWKGRKDLPDVRLLRREFDRF